MDKSKQASSPRGNSIARGERSVVIGPSSRSLNPVHAVANKP